MKTLKKLFMTTSILGAIIFFASGMTNSIVVDKHAFLKNDLNIKFAKRLDEYTGEFIVGRAAASLPKWGAKDSIAYKEVKQAKKVKSRRVTKTVKRIRKVKAEAEIVKAVPAPAVLDDLELQLTGGLYNKKPLVDGKGYSGIAKLQDGVIEAIDVTLPDGKSFSVNMNQAMVGNVFQYEDSETREMRSGLFYRVKKGQYMATLTDDTNFAGMRLEFKTEEAIRLGAKNKDEASWAMNEQSSENNANNDEAGWAMNEQSSENNDTYKDDIEKEFPAEEQYQQNEQAEESAGYQNQVTYAFKF